MLVRWIDPEKGVLEPEAFSLALSTPELAEKLSRRIIGEALSHFAGLPQRDPLWLTLNVGAGDLLRSELVEDLDPLAEVLEVVPKAGVEERLAALREEPGPTVQMSRRSNVQFPVI